MFTGKKFSMTLIIIFALYLSCTDSVLAAQLKKSKQI